MGLPSVADQTYGLMLIGDYADGDVLFNERGIMAVWKDGGWLYVESGGVRGFVHEEDLIRGEEAEQMYAYLEKRAARISAMLPAGVSREAYFFTAQQTVPYYENSAYAFRRITTQDTVIEKQAALAKTEAGIMEDMADDAREAGRLQEGDLAYVIENAGDSWFYVESGDVRGFVRKSALDRSASALMKIGETGEDSLSTAEEKIEPADNQATYYTLTSIKEGTKYSEIREKILELALSCVGNPYVWGGTSLTNGADCSGFVQTLYLCRPCIPGSDIISRELRTRSPDTGRRSRPAKRRPAT